MEVRCLAIGIAGSRWLIELSIEAQIFGVWLGESERNSGRRKQASCLRQDFMCERILRAFTFPRQSISITDTPPSLILPTSHILMTAIVLVR